MRPLAALPVRSLSGMSRLAEHLDPPERTTLTKALTLHTASICERAGTDVTVVTADRDVATWATDHGIAVLTDPGRGLDGAAETAVTAAGHRPWLVVHADLPLVSEEDIAAVVTACTSHLVLAPSHDGGTSVVAGTVPGFPFHYGPGSFRRHLAAAAGGAVVLCRPGLALDLDRWRDLTTARALGWRSDG